MTSPIKQRIVAVLLIGSLALNVALIASLANSGGLRRILLRLDLVKPPSVRAPFQVDDEGRFKLLPNTAAEIVFAGDSLIADGPWGELFTEVHNRGIGGDRTDNVLNRLDEILASRPKRIIFLLGANDLSTAVPPVQVLRNYRAILERVARESPATRVAVIGMLPVNDTIVGAPIYDNRAVAAVNGPLRALVGEFPGARYVDLAGRLADDKGMLRPEYTKDGMHLNLKGYLAIEPDVRAILEQS